MLINLESTRFIYEVLEQHEYSYVFDNLIVLDAGCNIGAFSFWIYPRAEIIHAVDLYIGNIDNLRQTIKANNLDKIRTYCCALAGNHGTRKAVEFNITPGDGSGHLDENGTVELDAYTINSFMSANRIDRVDILKLDVEGAEHEILQAQDFPREKVSTIIGEWHGATVGKALKDLGYDYRETGSHFIARR